MIIKLNKGELTNWTLIINDELSTLSTPEIPCITCDAICTFFGKPYQGSFKQIGTELTWTVKIDICKDITLEFDEFFIDGEPVIFDEKREI